MGVIENFRNELRDDLLPIRDGLLQRFGTPQERGRLWASENRLGQLAIISLQVRKLITDHREKLDVFTNGGRVDFSPIFDPKDRKSTTRAVPANVALFAIYHAARVNDGNTPEPQIRFNPNVSGKDGDSIFSLEITKGVYIAATLIGQEKNRAIANAINSKTARYKLSIIVGDPNGSLSKESADRERSFFAIGSQLQPEVVLKDILTRRPNATERIHSLSFYNVSTYFDEQFVKDYLSRVWAHSDTGVNSPAGVLSVNHINIDHTDNRGRKLEVRFEESTDFYESRRSARINDLDLLVNEELTACFKHAHKNDPVEILGNGRTIFATRYRAPVRHDAVFKQDDPSLKLPYYFNPSDVKDSIFNNLRSLHKVMNTVNRVTGSFGYFHEGFDLDDIVGNQPISIHYEVFKLRDNPKSPVNVVAWQNKPKK